MRILLVNDDGIYANGIISLAEKLSVDHEVIVVAPSRECSGTSHAITFFKALNYCKVNHIEGVEAYSLDGTPVDCVKLGIDVICKDRQPDIILSGINNQLNIGTDVIYSGTVNAAFEGAIMDFRSIAISTECPDDDFGFASDFIANNLYKLISIIPRTSTIININIPFTEKSKIKGVAISQLGIKKYDDRYELRAMTDGCGYYLIGEPITVSENPSDCDVELINEGYITISPLTIQFTDYKTLESIPQLDLII